MIKKYKRESKKIIDKIECEREKNILYSYNFCP